MYLVDRIEVLFDRHARRQGQGELAEPVSALERTILRLRDSQVV